MDFLRALFGGNREPAAVVVAPESRVVPLNYNNKTTTSQTEEAMDPKIFKALLERASGIPSIAAQRGSAEEVRGISENMLRMPTEIDLSPTAGFLKAVYGKDIGYKAPQSAEDKAAMLAKLQEMASGQEASATANTLAGIRAQLVNKQKTETKTGTADKFTPQPRIDPYAISPGEKAVDTKAAEEYLNRTAYGGAAESQKSLETLRDGIRLLESGKEDISGGVLREAPKWARTMISPEFPYVFNGGDTKAIAFENSMINAFKGGLKAAFGGNPSNADAKAHFESVYDRALTEAENAISLKRELKELEARALAREKALKYYEQNQKSLRGYDSGESQIKIPKDGGPAKQSVEDIDKEQADIDKELERIRKKREDKMKKGSGQ